MNVEHIAFNVAEPAATAQWYADHLGMQIVRANDDSPHIHFVAGDDGSMLEFYRRPDAEVPEYATIDPAMLHVAFATDDIDATRERLIAAGATRVGDTTTFPNGDQVAFLRDPWQLPIQLVKRSSPLV